MNWMLIVFSVFTSISLVIVQEMDVRYFKQFRSRIFKIYFKPKYDKKHIKWMLLQKMRRKKPVFASNLVNYEPSLQDKILSRQRHQTKAYHEGHLDPS